MFLIEIYPCENLSCVKALRIIEMYDFSNVVNNVFRTCYAANPRPDALMKEQLVEMTGLSPRVIRVWFQNKRCKDKKKTIQLKMQMQQEKVVITLLVFWFCLSC